MMNLKSNKGITLAVLILTIIVMIIITGVSVKFGIDSYQDSEKTHKESQLRIIQHAVFEKYIESQKIDIILPGEEVTDTDTLPDEFSTGSEEKYYILDINALKELGITTPDKNYANKYIVNYKSGEVYDVENKIFLGGYSSSNTANNTTSNMIDFDF